MKCPVHSDKDVVGYCVECGAFGCDTCLIPRGKGDNLCQKCLKTVEGSGRGQKGLGAKLLGDKKTPKPASRKPTFQRSSVVRKGAGGGGRKLIVKFRDNRELKGTTYKLDTKQLGFHFVPLDPAEESDRIFVYFSDVKMISFVRSLEGRPDPGGKAAEQGGDGPEVKLAFPGNEIIEGHLLHRFDGSAQRFFMAPKQDDGNLISILVERAALSGMEMEGYKEGIFTEESEEIAAQDAAKKGRAPLSQNESMGDLYFSMKNYDSALAEYEKVQKEYPSDKRLKLKMSVCYFNRGVNFIKSRKYTEAKVEFEKIDEDDPIYGKAKKKIRKIEKILKEVQSMGR